MKKLQLDILPDKTIDVIIFIYINTITSILNTIFRIIIISVEYK